MSLEEVIFAVHDPEGRLVVLTRERLDHIRRRHPEIGDPAHELLRAVKKPGESLAGVDESKEWLYASGVGPSRWLKVVIVRDERGTGRIITAFPRRAKP